MPIGMSIGISIGEYRTQKSGIQRRLLKMDLVRNFCRQLCCKRFNKGETFCWYGCPVVWSATCITGANNIVKNCRQAMRANDLYVTILWMKCMPLMLIQLQCNNFNRGQPRTLNQSQHPNCANHVLAVWLLAIGTENFAWLLSGFKFCWL